MKLPSSIISGGMDGRMIARKEIEQAEIDLDVAIGRLNAAQRQDAFARSRQARIVVVEPGQLQREIRLDRRAEIGWPLRIDIESAIGQLARQDGSRLLCRSAGAWADSRRHSPADAARAAAECSRIRASCRR